MLQSLSPKKIFQQCLVLSLALSISGVLPIIRTASASDPVLDFQAITQQGQALDDTLRLQIRRTRHPGTPGTPAGMPSPFDLSQIETDFAKWKLQIERALALPSQPVNPTDSYLPDEAKLRGINSYLNELTMMVTLRIALGLEHGPRWSDAYALEVPNAVITEIPGLGTLASNRMGDRFLPMTVDRGPDGNSEPARLKLSVSLVQGLELGRLADVQNEDTNLTMLKYLATRQLLANLSDLQYLKQDRHVEIPAIPAPLQAKLESMGLASVIAEEQHRAVAEPGARASIIQTYSSVSGQFPAFVNDALVTGIAKAVGKTPQERAAAKAPLQEVLASAERDNLSASLEQEVASSSVPFSVQNSAELDNSLRNTLSNAKANTQLQKVMELLANQTLGDLSVEQRRAVMDQLDARKASYLAQISPDNIRAWQDSAKRATDDLLYTQTRAQFIENLLFHASDAVKEINRTYSGDVVDVQILAQVFNQDVAKLGASDNAGDWFYSIRSAGSYLAARSKYNELITKQTSVDVVVGGIVSPAKVEDFIAHHDFDQPVPFTANTPLVLQQRIRDRIANSRREDIRALVQYGAWLGFHSVYAGTNPSVHEVLTDAKRADDYFKKLDESTETSYPVLGTQISITTPQGTETQARLADALAALNPNHVSSPEIEGDAQLLVDQGLIQIESKIDQDIQTIGSAKSAAEIEKVVTSSMMLSLVMHGYPEFHLYEEEFVEQLLSPSLMDQIMHRYAGPSMLYGFGAVMIIKAINWTAKKVVKKAFPFTNVVAIGMDSIMAGFMRAAIVLIIADEAYEFSQVAHQRAQRQQQEDFFFCSAQGGCFTDSGTLNDANAAYAWAKWSLVGRMITDTAFFYFPMARGVLTRAGDRLVMAELVGDNQAFRAMGSGPGEFGSVEARMNIAKAIREGRPIGAEIAGKPYDVRIVQELQASVPKMSAEEWNQFEQGYSRLSAKIKAGQTYRLPTVIDRMAIEDAFKTLDLSAKKPASWDKIESARAVHARAATTPAAETKVERAAKFLKTYLAETPDVKTREFVSASTSERKLLAALKRGPTLEQFWSVFADEESDGLHLNIPGPDSKGAVAQ